MSQAFSSACRSRAGLLAGWLAVGLLAALAACGGGSDLTTPLNDGYGPGSPSACPRARQADAWFNNRIACLAGGQRFISGAPASGDRADRAYILGQEVLDQNFNNVLGANIKRYFKFAVCVRGAPANLPPLSLAGDLATALGLNVLATGTTFYPQGVSGSTFWYGGINDTSTVQVACDAAVHPVIVGYDSGRVESVNAGALSALVIVDR